jgi:hypothetical protein
VFFVFVVDNGRYWELERVINLDIVWNDVMNL